MISPEEGLAILKNWKRAMTVLSLFTLPLADVMFEREVRIREATASALVVEFARNPTRTLDFNLEGAAFDEVGPDEIPSSLLSPEDAGGFSLFLLIRLAGDGLRISFAVPASIN